MNDDKLDKILEKLDRIIDLMSRENTTIQQIDLPFTPYHQQQWPTKFPQPFPEVNYNRCVKCGLHLGGVMGYVCNDSQCPTFPTATSTVSSTILATNPGPGNLCCESVAVFGTKSTEGYNG